MKNDIFNATGDVFPATGKLMIARKKDPFNTKKDFFHRDTGDDLPAQTTLAQDSGYNISGNGLTQVPSYSTSSVSTNKNAPNKTLGFIDQLFGTASKGADVYNKLKYGQSGTAGMINYDANLGMYNTQVKDNSIYYIAGGVVVMIVIIGVVLSKKSK
jgi:hypothetical protein